METTQYFINLPMQSVANSPVRHCLSLKTSQRNMFYLWNTRQKLKEQREVEVGTEFYYFVPAVSFLNYRREKFNQKKKLFYLQEQNYKSRLKIMYTPSPRGMGRGSTRPSFHWESNVDAGVEEAALLRSWDMLPSPGFARLMHRGDVVWWRSQQESHCQIPGNETWTAPGWSDLQLFCIHLHVPHLIKGNSHYRRSMFFFNILYFYLQCVNHSK